MCLTWEELENTDEHINHTLYEALKNPIRIFHP